MKYLALDIGKSKIGIAVTDESGIIVSPRGYLEVKADLMHRLGEVVHEEKPELIVIGLPRHQNGDESGFANQIRKFAKGVEHEYNVKVDFESESGTTKLAEERLRDAGKNVQEIKSLVDAESAVVILESYLDRT